MDRTLELRLSGELLEELEALTRALGMADVAATAAFGLAEWIRAKRAELEAGDTAATYFVNAALDELAKRRP
ncbi:MAG TPA: hypothetical protein VFB15_09445 [Candidatus Binataceae bacterium]|nr:hypothetical protein [Candidatus Binataceae bacterium]